ncbi:MAG: S8 family serine peptidase [candidate division NC10 bacterium]
MAKRQRRSARAKSAIRRRTLAGGDRQPVLEALSVVLQPAPGRDALALARQIARRVRLNGWRVESVVENGTEVEIVPRKRSIGVARAWDFTYALRDQPEVAHAEPMFRYLVPENAPPVVRKASGGGRTDDPATDTEYDWSLRKANVLAAWRLFGPRLPGAGVHVGHPDTGYTLHPELADPARLLVTAGYDYDDDDPDPVDDLNDGFLDNPSHGTGTGSVILSGVGAANGGPGPFVSGAAPNAMLIPIRTTESVVLFSMRGLRRAIDHAATYGAQVVSISLGGPFPGLSTRRAIQRAVEAGTIILAAAGNEVGFVVFPAAFDEVIAVAASNIRDEPWTGSSHGLAVDITAPGESVWRARTERDQNGRMKFLVERGNGTSFAVATTAGVAALWVSYHGWPTLVRKYGAANIARVFKQLLQASCRTPRGWDTHEYGPGVVDAKKLLAAPLPDAAPARKLRDARRAAVAADATGLETLVHLLPDVPRTRVEETIADLLQVPDRDLPSILQDYGDELAFQLVMRPGLLQTLGQRARGGRAAGSARTAVKRRLSKSGLSSRLRRQLGQR